MKNLTLNDKNIIKHLGYPKIVSLNDGYYLVKKISLANGVRELLGTYIGKIMKVVVPDNYIVNLDDEWYLLSEDLNKKGKLISASNFLDFDKEDTSLPEIWTKLEEKEKYSLTLVSDIVKIYIFDILFKNTDRRLDNLGFLKKDDGSECVVMFDFEKCLDFSTNNLYLHAGENFNDYMNDFEYFLENYSDKYGKLFMTYFNNLNPEYIDSIIEKIIKDNNINEETIKRNLVSSYCDNYEVLNEIMNKGKMKSGCR